MQREHVLDNALGLLEQQGLATATLEMLAEKLDVQPGDLKRFWPDREALLYDCLRYHGQQIDTWRRQLLLDENLSPQQSCWRAMTCWRNTCSKTATPAACLSLPAASSRKRITRSISWRSSKADLAGADPRTAARNGRRRRRHGGAANGIDSGRLPEQTAGKTPAPGRIGRQTVGGRHLAGGTVPPQRGAELSKPRLRRRQPKAIAGTGAFLRPLPEKPATGGVLTSFTHKAVDGHRPIRFNAARCPDSSVGRAGD